MENEIGRMVKCIKSNNSGEYYSRAFDDCCSYNRIRRIMIVPRMPQQNGVLERMDRTIPKCARSMMIHLGLPL